MSPMSYVVPPRAHNRTAAYSRFNTEPTSVLRPLAITLDCNQSNYYQKHVISIGSGALAVATSAAKIAARTGDSHFNG